MHARLPGREPNSAVFSACKAEDRVISCKVRIPATTTCRLRDDPYGKAEEAGSSVHDGIYTWCGLFPARLQHTRHNLLVESCVVGRGRGCEVTSASW